MGPGDKIKVVIIAIIFLAINLDSRLVAALPVLPDTPEPG